jgi:fucose 4-O-acetylase-like acetyltransferase
MKSHKVYLNNITLLNSFAIVLVVLGHVFDRIQQYNDSILFMNKVVHSFHMPLFFFLSGFLFIHTNCEKRHEYFSLIYKKIRRLLIPYLFFSTVFFFINYFIKIIYPRLDVRPNEFNAETYFHGLIYPWENVINTYWFLPTLMVIFLIAPILLKVINSNIKMLIVIVSLLIVALHIFNPASRILIFNINGVVHYLIYFWLGCLGYKIRGLYDKLNGYTFIISMAVLIFLNCLFINLYLIVALVGIMMSFSFIKIYCDKKWRFINDLNEKSYQIYLIHGPIIAYTFNFLNIFRVNKYIISVFSFILGIGIPILVTNLLVRKKSKFKFLLGL